MGIAPGGICPRTDGNSQVRWQTFVLWGDFVMDEFVCSEDNLVRGNFGWGWVTSLETGTVSRICSESNSMVYTVSLSKYLICYNILYCTYAYVIY